MSLILRISPVESTTSSSGSSQASTSAKPPAVRSRIPAPSRCRAICSDPKSRDQSLALGRHRGGTASTYRALTNRPPTGVYKRSTPKVFHREIPGVRNNCRVSQRAPRLPRRTCARKVPHSPTTKRVSLEDPLLQIPTEAERSFRSKPNTFAEGSRVVPLARGPAVRDTYRTRRSAGDHYLRLARTALLVWSRGNCPPHTLPTRARCGVQTRAAR